MISNKFAWTWTIKEKYLDEYIEMHFNPWKEVLEEHSKVGIKNYSIFQNGRQFFYCFECNDVENAFRYLNESTTCQKWNEITSKMVEGSFDLGDPQPISAMREVFYLK